MKKSPVRNDRVFLRPAYDSSPKISGQWLRINVKTFKKSVMKPFDGHAATVGNGSMLAVYCMTV
ncbi:hypothetical protein [Limnohabitans sp. Hippo4]|jgi:hypothetical protein|uniref:hypothetical protein n=1 Tax=Limnohabitans sp. Hippo4 TaxID=1826167 RepID=UPI000D33A453|nr:hypothetical protein [Limnohabitans sp. Hippo4]PUE38019.1 hypothetical protein B9Z46_04925 [Limnohabitans sp. Hippo4]